MKMKPVALGAGLLLAASLCLLVGGGSRNQKDQKNQVQANLV